MKRLQDAIMRTIRRHELLPAGARLLVGLSGGSDSVALVHLLRDLAPRGRFEIAGLAHLNHGLRASADRDEAFCRELARSLAFPLLVERADVQGYASAAGLSVEDAARRLRYDFLRRSARDLGATRIAVGHTQDDQAETFLLKLIRGAGAAGLGAIYPRRDEVIRPLLDVSRSDLRDYLSCRGQPWMEDETNESLENPRNRLRHVVLPELVRTYGGDVRGACARAAELIRDDGTLLDEFAATIFDRVAMCRGGTIQMDAAVLRTEGRPITRRVLLRALKSVAGTREVGLPHVQAGLDLLAGHGGRCDIPGGRMELRDGKLVLWIREGLSRSDTLTES